MVMIVMMMMVIMGGGGPGGSEMIRAVLYKKEEKLCEESKESNEKLAGVCLVRACVCVSMDAECDCVQTTAPSIPSRSCCGHSSIVPASIS